MDPDQLTPEEIYSLIDRAQDSAEINKYRSFFNPEEEAIFKRIYETDPGVREKYIGDQPSAIPGWAFPVGLGPANIAGAAAGAVSKLPGLGSVAKALPLAGAAIGAKVGFPGAGMRLGQAAEHLVGGGERAAGKASQAARVAPKPKGPAQSTSSARLNTRPKAPEGFKLKDDPAPRQAKHSNLINDKHKDVMDPSRADDIAEQVTGSSRPAGRGPQTATKRPVSFSDPKTPGARKRPMEDFDEADKRKVMFGGAKLGDPVSVGGKSFMSREDIKKLIEQELKRGR